MECVAQRQSDPNVLVLRQLVVLGPIDSSYLMKDDVYEILCCDWYMYHLPI